ncbi:hypothetical protein DFH09DRAFT_1318171 [Mycena vulgaris]|nr:hypothetical protein DFH09DRAFT_1318171 [Mycena vulgaris]
MSDSKLPEPWFCNWEAWGLLPYWHNLTILSLDDIADSPWKCLGIRINKLLMFRSAGFDNTTTMFAGEAGRARRKAYYLYDSTSQDVYRFNPAQEPIAKAIEDFIECRLQQHDAPGIPAGKRNLLAMTHFEGTWSSRAREHWVERTEYYRHDPPHAAAWPAIPDAQLPTPFTCTWHAFAPELRKCWGVAGFTPVVYTADSPHACAFHCLTVLRLWMRKFEGTYESVEDFMENADWNGLSPMKETEAWLEK